MNVKKIIRLINNERTGFKNFSGKACEDTSFNRCQVLDAATCTVNSYDVCTKDYAACYNKGYDFCDTTTIDYDACVGSYDYD